ncbi:MAG: 2-C-methyl-D-erythritol 2,4-cyclodiphosphate synthase [Oscillospiraceae bacterium]|nr:2-C-methyl-D-erythritol 2,4-cyclodiphosphate synthase [Oscillospiraceae bacterium]
MRIGFGYDVHRLVPDRRLILCGVDIAYEKGLLGHSDADVAVHALMDAVLGALALGDIGHLFPDSDPKHKDADSMELLRVVIGKMDDEGYALGNLDVTIIAERPKLAPYIVQMRENLAAAFRCGISRVSIKATTEEGLGLGGAGIGANAVVLLEEKK